MKPGPNSSLLYQIADWPARFENRIRRPDRAGRSAAEAVPEAGPARLFQIVVKCQGSLIAEHVITAATALAAINLVELSYSEPLCYGA